MAELKLFLAMGGYGAYVWSAYAITFVVLLLNIVWTHQQFQTIVRSARRLNVSKDDRIKDRTK